MGYRPYLLFYVVFFAENWACMANIGIVKFMTALQGLTHIVLLNNNGLKITILFGGRV